MSGREHLIAWLDDAYAMEKALEETPQRHAGDAKDDSVRRPEGAVPFLSGRVARGDQ